jgi:predicted NBD/HSP70 family sugar kinase
MHAFGIDPGGTKIHGAELDEHNYILFHHRIPARGAA